VHCSKVLSIEESNIDALVNRAEASVMEEDYDSAIRDYQKAHEADRHNQKVPFFLA